jgi:hypothetical protein
MASLAGVSLGRRPPLRPRAPGLQAVEGAFARAGYQRIDLDHTAPRSYQARQASRAYRIEITSRVAVTLGLRVRRAARHRSGSLGQLILRIVDEHSTATD